MRLRLVMALALSLGSLPTVINAQANGDLVSSLERLAAQGNGEATYHLGMMYHTGSGVPEDHSKAFAAFQKAAALGDPLAAYKVGCYFAGQGEGVVEDDLTNALKYKLVAAEAGYALAQQDVAAIYARSGDMQAALKWLERSAAQGWEGGLASLAAVYNGAPGVERDPAKVAGYFRLFLARVKSVPKQSDWLSTFEKTLTPEEEMRAAEIVRTYRPQPTELTLKALSGQRAAVALVSRER